VIPNVAKPGELVYMIVFSFDAGEPMNVQHRILNEYKRKNSAGFEKKCSWVSVFFLFLIRRWTFDVRRSSFKYKGNLSN